jgi:transposase-like protein
MKTPSSEPESSARVIDSLPHPNTKRWVVRRKAAVVAAVRTGGITIEEACRAYQLSEEEFLSWVSAFEKHGLAGLRVTRVQHYRASRSKRAAPRFIETTKTAG